LEFGCSETGLEFGCSEIGSESGCSVIGSTSQLTRDAELPTTSTSSEPDGIMRPMRLLSVTAAVSIAAAASLSVASCHVSDEGYPSTELPQTSGSEASSSPAPHPAEIAHDLPRSATPLEVGTTAPAFRLSTATETLSSANALRAGPLVLVFYIGDFCIYCRRQLEQIQSRIQDFQGAHATVWAISADAPSTSAALTRTLHLDFPLPSDQDLTVIRAFGVESSGASVALPSVFVIQPDGHISYRHVGANQADRAGVDEILTAARAAAAAH
jgi:peroxiredoxin